MRLAKYSLRLYLLNKTGAILSPTSASQFSYNFHTNASCNLNLRKARYIHLHYLVGRIRISTTQISQWYLIAKFALFYSFFFLFLSQCLVELALEVDADVQTQLLEEFHHLLCACGNWLLNVDVKLIWQGRRQGSTKWQARSNTAAANFDKETNTQWGMSMYVREWKKRK